MNDQAPRSEPDDALDELLNAYVDDEASPEERARVESSPELLARVEALRAVAGELATPVIVDPARRERAIATALAAFGAVDEGADVDLAPASPPPAPLSLDAARSRRAARWLAPLMAGAVAATAVGLFVVNRNHTSSKSSSTAAAIPTRNASAVSTPEAGTAPTLSGGATPNPAFASSSSAAASSTTEAAAASTTTAAASSTIAASAPPIGTPAYDTAGLPFLGALTTDDDVVTAVGPLLAPPTTTTGPAPSSTAAGAATTTPPPITTIPATTAAGASAPCPSLTVTPVAAAIWQSRPVWVYVVPAPGGGREVALVDQQSCLTSATVPLP
jgi:hypothetical protein